MATTRNFRTQFPSDQMDSRGRIRDLESKLASVQQQRDDLAKDLEIMCLESKPITFDTSSVLRERIFATGTEKPCLMDREKTDTC